MPGPYEAGKGRQRDLKGEDELQSYLEQAFGKSDVTSAKMRAALREWLDLYYGAPRPGEDAAPRLAALIVGKLCRTVFAEYETRLPAAAPEAVQRSLEALNAAARTAMQYALVGGECLLKPVPADGGFDFTAIRRDCYVPLARDAHGRLLAVGTMERHSCDGRQYALLERRTAGAEGLTIETRLFELNGQVLGRCVPLSILPACAALVPQLMLPGVQGVGLAVLRMPLMNCVDGSTDAVSIYAPAAGLLHALARCEEQLNTEFANGASRVFASEDLLRPDAQGRRALRDDLFVGLPDDPANVGVTVYSPALREQSYLARKQDLLRGCESLLGLRRGILSELDGTGEPRTATEITATAVDYDLTIRDLQAAWADTVRQAMALCGTLGALYGVPHGAADAAPSIDWGDGVLYDRARVWAEQREMVDAGLLRPELALAIAAKIDSDCMEALQTASLIYDGSKAAISYNAIVDAVDLFEEEMGCSDKVLFIHPKQVTQLRKNPDFLCADQYTPGVGLTGEIGMIAGCRLVPSKKVPLADGVYACPIVKLEADPEVDDEIPALTIYRKREVNIETERKPKTRTTEITADEFYVAVLSNEAKVVLAKFKA